jgi:serine protease
MTRYALLQDTITAADAFGCRPPLTPVYRAYNNGFERGIDSNHRITANVRAYQSMRERGWIGEGVVMCAPQ